MNSLRIEEKLREATGKNLTYAEFMEITEEAEVDRVMLECVDNLTSALLSVINILNTQLILLGLDCCSWPDRYISRVEQEVNRLKFGNKNIRIPVKKTFFMRDSQLLGAACHGLNAMFNGDLPEIFS